MPGSSAESRVKAMEQPWETSPGSSRVAQEFQAQHLATSSPGSNGFRSPRPGPIARTRPGGRRARRMGSAPRNPGGWSGAEGLDEAGGFDDTHHQTSAPANSGISPYARRSAPATLATHRCGSPRWRPIRAPPSLEGPPLRRAPSGRACVLRPESDSRAETVARRIAGSAAESPSAPGGPSALRRSVQRRTARTYRWPETLSQLFPCDDFSGAFKEAAIAGTADPTGALRAGPSWLAQDRKSTSKFPKRDTSSPPVVPPRRGSRSPCCDTTLAPLSSAPGALWESTWRLTNRLTESSFAGSPRPSETFEHVRGDRPLERQ